MTEIRHCSAKQHDDLAAEWDRLAEERHRQIASGDDISFDHVIAPTILKLFAGANPSLVLDVGSGTGDFTARLARVAERVVGLEPSAASVEIARTVCAGLSNVRFLNRPIEEAKEALGGEAATAAVATMTLMTTPNLPRFAEALRELLQDGGKFVAVVTHPCFWPRYWGYEEADWFDYEREIFIEAPFVISLRRTPHFTTHIHRPLEQYLTTFADLGFSIEKVVEPMPPAEIEALYPMPWQFPRFLGLRWVKG